MTATRTAPQRGRGKRYYQRMRKATTIGEKLHAEYEFLRSVVRHAAPGSADAQVVQLTRYIRQIREFLQETNAAAKTPAERSS